MYTVIPRLARFFCISAPQIRSALYRVKEVQHACVHTFSRTNARQMTNSFGARNGAPSASGCRQCRPTVAVAQTVLSLCVYCGAPCNAATSCLLAFGPSLLCLPSDSLAFCYGARMLPRVLSLCALTACVLSELRYAQHIHYSTVVFFVPSIYMYFHFLLRSSKCI